MVGDLAGRALIVNAGLLPYGVLHLVSRALRRSVAAMRDRRLLERAPREAWAPIVFLRSLGRSPLSHHEHYYVAGEASHLPCPPRGRR
jgi:hypothetical protein